ncbi:Fructosamine kinase-domain-containing protein [Syncephalis plumigaleata]|nr:Fructosamine kinase-domain-containing protein [Syncephalis plumigaleata]
MEYPILYPKSNSSDTQSIWTTPYHPPRKVAAKPLLIHAPAPLPTASSSPYVNRVALMSSHQLSPMTYYMIDAPRPNDHLCVDGRPHCWTCIYLIPSLQQHGYCTIVHKVSSISGGCISDTCRYETDQGVFFVKIQQGDNALSMFQAEYLSLSLINHAIKGFAPQPMLYGTLDNGRGAYLVMEYRKLAHRLVELHRISAITSFDSSDPLIAQINELNLDEFHITSNKSNVYTRHYGFPCTTFCGTTPQTNKAWPGSWSTFWRDQRLQPLLTMLKHDKQLTD